MDRERSDETYNDTRIGELYDAIVEGRRDDAITILNELAGEDFRSVALQHNLFPSRVPA